MDEAQALYRHILRDDPAQVDALHLTGVVALQQGKPLDGIAWMAKAVALQPAHLDAQMNLGTALLSVGRHEEALRHFDAALGLKPELPDILNRRGAALAHLGRHADALRSHDEALALRPDFPEAAINRGNALAKLGRFDDALQVYAQVLAASPGNLDAAHNRASVLLAAGRYGEAIEDCGRVLGAVPNHLPSLIARANALRHLNRHEEALGDCARALQLSPGNIDALMFRCLALRGLNRLDEALSCSRQVQALAPGLAAAQFQEALCHLTMGQLTMGWPGYEARWKTEEAAAYRRDFAQPLWLGDTPLAGKTLLIHAEQGLGDAIQFVRYAALAQAAGARVVLEVPASLIRLFRAQNAGCQVVSRGKPLPDFDIHCPMLSLPLAFRTTLSSIPFTRGYLRSDPALTSTWGVRLGTQKRLRVGVVWAGHRAHGNNQNRSMALEQFEKLLGADADFFSLSKDVSPQDRARLQARGGIRLCGDDFEDFADTAALVSHLDLVISVDTAVAHLAGAMGVPVWLLLPFSPDWRWLLDRSDSPWYPSARLFRQAQAGDWAPVVLQVAQALRAQAAAR